jgi:hypothetical protein
MLFAGSVVLALGALSDPDGLHVRPVQYGEEERLLRLVEPVPDAAYVQSEEFVEVPAFSDAQVVRNAQIVRGVPIARQDESNVPHI